jgi:tetratricopeptide (TPR) repeat protein
MPIAYDKKKFNVRPEVWICMFLVFSTLLIYFQAGRFEFVNFDTDKYVYENEIVKDGLTLKGTQWAFTTVFFGNWHPLTWLSHMLDVQLYGLHPGRHHLTSVLLHIVNTLLLFGVLRSMTGKLGPSGFVAALFALHPLHVESVAWVSERKDVMSTLFGLLALWSYTRYVLNPAISRYVPVLIFFILSLMAKPMMVTLPFLLLLLDYWPLRRLHFEKANKIAPPAKRGPGIWFLIVEKLPLFILSAAASAVTYYAQSNWGSVVSLDAYAFSFRLANALTAYVSYIGKMIWPAKLAIIYPYGQIIPVWQIWLAGGLMIGLTLLSAICYKSRPWFPVGWLWYLGTLVPVIGLVQVGAQSMADRYTYVPYIGLFIIIAWGLFEFLKRWSHPNLRYAVIAVVISGVLMGLTWKQIGYWRDGVTLFKRALDITENNFIAENNLGHALLMKGEFSQAAGHFKKCLDINPRYIKAYLNLGLAFAQLDKPEQALQAYTGALAEKQDFAEAYNFAGITNVRRGNFEQAVFNFQQAVKINPAYTEAHNNLGNALFRLGKHDEALASFEQALTHNPDDATTHKYLGNFWYHTGHSEKALPYYLQAIKINPKSAEAYNGAGAALIRMGETRKAAAFFDIAVKIDPDYVAAQDNLKNTLAALNSE